MSRHLVSLLILVVVPALAQTVDLSTGTELAYAAYREDRFAASDSLYTLAFEAPAAAPSEWDFYYAVCSAARSGHDDRAFERLEASAQAGFEDTSFPHRDADLASLNPDDPRWAAFESAVVASMQVRYGASFDPALWTELSQIRTTDQAGRFEAMRVRREADPVIRDSLVAALWAQQTLSDEANLGRIEQIVVTRGWPGFRLVGRTGSNTVFLVVQHAELEAQQRYLPLLRAAVDAGEAEPSDLALLIDRVRVRTGHRQVYGSQVSQNEETGAMEFDPIEDEATVDARRAEMGLEPLADYARNFGFEYVPPAE